MIAIRTSKQIQHMRESGKRLAASLHTVRDATKPGITLSELETVAYDAIIKNGGIPSFKGYQQRPSDPSFPTALCASLNHEIVHGPANRTISLKDGDIIGLDLGLSYNNWYTDMAITVPVGTVTPDVQKLIDVTRDALTAGIGVIKANIPLITISNAIYNVITSHTYGVVTGFCGHGVGKSVHEEPMIPNYPTPSASTIFLRSGMTLALEPMVTMGDPTFTIAEDGWTAFTKDGSLASHFEHTILVTDTGAEILTSV